MARPHSDEYDDYGPLLVRFAGLAAADPRRARLREELVAGFLPVAQHIARRFARRGEPVDDLEQVASIGLLNALERFDPGRERDFLSFAVPTITGEVRRYFRDVAWSVRTPRAIKDRYVAVGAATTRLGHQLGRAPTAGELAEHLQMSREEVTEAIAAHGSYQPTSLDAALTGGSEVAGSALLDTLAVGDAGLDRAEQRAMLADLVRHLPERERAILVLRFVHDRTQAEIGAELCISQMHVSRLLGRTLTLLRERVEAGDDVALPAAG